MATYPLAPYDEEYDHSRAKEDARNAWQHEILDSDGTFTEDDQGNFSPVPGTMDDPAARVARDALMPQACGECGTEPDHDGAALDHFGWCPRYQPGPRELALSVSPPTAGMAVLSGLSTDDEDVLRTHLTSGWYKQAAVLKGDRKAAGMQGARDEITEVLKDLHRHFWAAFAREHP